MPRWSARITFFTAAKGLREWQGEVEADTAELATELAMRQFRLSRPGLVVPEIADFQVDLVEE